MQVEGGEGNGSGKIEGISLLINVLRREHPKAVNPSIYKASNRIQALRNRPGCIKAEAIEVYSKQGRCISTLTLQS